MGTLISTRKQNIERQIRNIKEQYPDALIIQEIYTGSKFQGRKELEKLLRQVKSGDSIIFDSVSRMSRDAEDGFLLYKELFERGITLIFLKEPHINTDTYKKAIESQVTSIKIDTKDSAADDLVNGILDAIKKYILVLAEKQIRLAFEQAEEELTDLH